MRRLFEELVQQLERLRVGLDRLDGLCDLARPRLVVELAQLLGGRRSYAAIVLGKPRIPPDSCLHTLRQLQARQIGTGFAISAIHVDEVWPRNQHVRSLGFTRVHVVARRLQRWTSRHVFAR